MQIDAYIDVKTSTAEHRAEQSLPLLDFSRPAWHSNAACRGKLNLFFGNQHQRAAARLVCVGCPVQEECAAEGAKQAKRFQAADGVRAGQ